MLLLDNLVHFSYVVHGLHHSLLDLGIPNNITNTINNPDAIYILCTAHRAPLPPKFIAYNFEQLTTTKEWPQTLFEHLKKAIMVWDFSLENISVLKKHGIPAVHVPLGYDASMEHLLPPVKKDIAVMFVGTLNSRRKTVLQNFSKPPVLNVTVVNAWGPSLSRWYSRSKIALNMHYYEGLQLLEIHRIIPFLIHRVWVVSERSHDAWLDNEYSDLVDFYPLQELKAGCMHILNQSNYDMVVERRYMMFKQRCMYKHYIKNILQATVA